MKYSHDWQIKIAAILQQSGSEVRCCGDQARALIFAVCGVRLGLNYLSKSFALNDLDEMILLG